MGFLDTALSFGLAVNQHFKYRELLEMDRDGACQALATFVEQSPAGQLDAFEKAFLEHSTAMMDASHRIRAMELYAYLKMKEMAHYGKFRGFMATCAAL